MCDNCFQEYIYRFESQHDFEAFENRLQDKCRSNKLTIIDRHHTDYLSAFDSKLYYRCNACNELWVMSIPENAWRGYFLPEKVALEYTQQLRRKDKNKRVGCLIVLTIIVVIVILNIWF